MKNFDTVIFSLKGSLLEVNNEHEVKLFDEALLTLNKLASLIKIYIIGCNQEIDLSSCGGIGCFCANEDEILSQEGTKLLISDLESDYEFAAKNNLTFAFAAYKSKPNKSYTYILKKIEDVLFLLYNNPTDYKILSLSPYYHTYTAKDAQVSIIYNPLQNDYQYMFGFWHMGKNKKDNDELFDVMEKEVFSSWSNQLIGPINYSTYFDYRLAKDNFNWKLNFDVNNDFKQIEYLVSRNYKEKYLYTSTLTSLDKELYDKAKKTKLHNDYKITINHRFNVAKYIYQTYEIYKDAYFGTDLFSPIDYDSYERIYVNNLKGINPDLVMIYHQNEAVAFAFGYENIKLNHYVAKTIAIKKDYQNSKIVIKLIEGIYDVVTQKGYKKIVYPYQLKKENNLSRLWRKNILKQKEYALYTKNKID